MPARLGPGSPPDTTPTPTPGPLRVAHMGFKRTLRGVNYYSFDSSILLTLAIYDSIPSSIVLMLAVYDSFHSSMPTLADYDNVRVRNR